MNIETWKQCILEVVGRVADKAYQEETWLGGAEQVCSPTELYCELFDDYMFEDFLSSSDVVLTLRQRKLGEELLREMNRYAEATPELLEPQQVLADPAWEKLRETARSFLEACRDSEQ